MVRLESVEIERFRGVRAGRIDGFADVNVIVGRNNSGKSTVAEAITRVAVAAADAKADLIGRSLLGAWQEARSEVRPLSPELWYRNDASQSLSVRVAIGGSTMSLSIQRSSPDQFDLRTHHRAQPGSDIERFARFLTVLRPKDAFEQVEQKLWSDLLATRRDKALVTALQEIFGIGVEQLQLPPDGRLRLLFPDYAVALDAQGDGTRAALRYLMVLSALQNTLLILEEPESHQHPGALERFAAAVCKLARAQGVQILLTTHSVECVRAFLKASAEASSEFALLHLKLEDGQLDARRFDAEAVEALFASGTDVRWLDLYG